MSLTAAPQVKNTSQVILICTGILLTMLPVTMLVPVLKEIVGLRYQVSLFWTHSFMSMNLIGGILAAPLAGRIIDRSGRRRSLIATALMLNAVCFWGMAIADNFWTLMFIRFLEGAMHITALSAWMATGADISRGGQAGRVMGALGGIIILGITIGVPLGGVVAGEEPVRILWVAGGFSILAALVAIGLKPVISGSNAYSQMDSLRRSLSGNRWLLIPYIYTFIDRLSIGVVVSTLSLYMSDILQLSPAQRGMMLSFFLMPFALLSYPAGRLSDAIGRVWMMSIGSLGFGLVFMTYGTVGNSWLPAVMIASGILSAAMFAPTLALLKDLSHTQSHGQTFAAYNIAGSLGFIAGPFLGGGLLTAFQSQPIEFAYASTFAITGLFEIFCAAATLPFLLRLMSLGRIR